jgi:hypothetical protein
MSGAKEHMAQLAYEDRSVRASAATAIYAEGCALGEAAIESWRALTEFAALLAGPPTVGIAVAPERFAMIRAAMGAPRLAEVPPDQDAMEFEVHLGETRLDILTTREPRGAGAIARFLEKFGEGIQQVEFPVREVDRATSVLAERLGVKAIYPETRDGADGTRVNFFLAATREGKKVLVELVETR